jgi:hypothetical protein
MRALCWAALGGAVSLGVYAQDVVQCANWAGQFDEMNRVCCADQPGGECPNGFPPDCSEQCASVFAIFSDDCEGMLDLLGLATPEYVDFTAKCQESFVPEGVADCGTDGCEDSGVRVQFDLDMTVRHARPPARTHARTHARTRSRPVASRHCASFPPGCLILMMLVLGHDPGCGRPARCVRPSLRDVQQLVRTGTRTSARAATRSHAATVPSERQPLPRTDQAARGHVRVQVPHRASRGRGRRL